MNRISPVQLAAAAGIAALGCLILLLSSPPEDQRPNDGGNKGRVPERAANVQVDRPGGPGQQDSAGGEPETDQSIPPSGDGPDDSAARDSSTRQPRQSPSAAGRELRARLRSLVEAGEFDRALEEIAKSVLRWKDGKEEEILATYAVRMLPYLAHKASSPSQRVAALSLLGEILATRPGENLTASALVSLAGSSIGLGGLARTPGDGNVDVFLFEVSLPGPNSDPAASLGVDLTWPGVPDPRPMIAAILDRRGAGSSTVELEAALHAAGALGLSEELRAGFEIARGLEKSSPDEARYLTMVLLDGVRRGSETGRLSREGVRWIFEHMDKPSLDGPIETAILDALPMGVDRERELAIAYRAAAGGRNRERGLEVLMENGAQGDSFVREKIATASLGELALIATVGRRTGANRFLAAVEERLASLGRGALEPPFESLLAEWRVTAGNGPALERIGLIEGEIASIEARITLGSLDADEKRLLVARKGELWDEKNALLTQIHDGR